jgi:hypothetical protein
MHLEDEVVDGVVDCVVEDGVGLGGGTRALVSVSAGERKVR